MPADAPDITMAAVWQSELQQLQQLNEEAKQLAQQVDETWNEHHANPADQDLRERYGLLVVRQKRVDDMRFKFLDLQAKSRGEHHAAVHPASCELPASRHLGLAVVHAAMPRNQLMS